MKWKQEIRLFTVEEANRTLPLVRRIMADLLEDTRQLEALLPRLEQARLVAQRADDGTDSGLQPIREEVAAVSGRLETYLHELSQVGCLFKGAAGLVDFYSLLDGQPVFLCWKYGEEEIGYWHELEAGFAGRKPLLPVVAGHGREG